MARAPPSRRPLLAMAADPDPAVCSPSSASALSLLRARARRSSQLACAPSSTLALACFLQHLPMVAAPSTPSSRSSLSAAVRSASSSRARASLVPARISPDLSASTPRCRRRVWDPTCHRDRRRIVGFHPPWRFHFLAILHRQLRSCSLAILLSTS
ncbi:uncharacterized protein LOC100191232 [Zea mays]|uniref:Uncharacterized protein n=1 Tax=Zea mays TaxID=4577 RepID=B4F830_MAIZE|nr:uncharacterized protein LOC100191232 [Zea mays]ACF78273.1 unknown [Zea mays]|eukprot:NP_001130138.1 uncharacterized protein LOC100191232 [Zea mays]